MRLQMPSFTNLGDLIHRDRDPDKVAIIDPGGDEVLRELTYAQLDSMANGVARALMRRGRPITWGKAGVSASASRPIGRLTPNSHGQPATVSSAAPRVGASADDNDANKALMPIASPSRRGG